MSDSSTARRGRRIHREAESHARSARPTVSPQTPPDSDHALLAWVALLLVLALAAVFAWREETSLDLGFHVASGRWILEHRAWPRLDPFTYTVASHPYVDMHGLFQIAAALAYGAGGMRGVGLLRVALVLATTAVVWGTARRRGVRSPALMALGFGLGLCAWELRFVARPELASFLMLSLELYLLRRHGEDGRARWLWAIVPLQLVWVYSHALSLFGLAVLGLYALSSLVPGAPRRRRDLTPWLVLAASLGASLLNPYGLAGLAFLWGLRTRIESGNPFAGSIGELASPFSAAAAGFWPIVVFKVLLVAAPFVLILSVRRRRWFEAALVGMFAALAATRVRNIGLFVVAALPVMLEAASDVTGSFPSRSRRWVTALPVARAATLLVLLFVGEQVVSGGYYAANLRPMRFGSRESPAVYPTRALACIEAEGLRGPIYNALDFGGYLLLHLWPGEKVFIDGRLEVMGESFYSEYASIEAGSGWADMVRRYQPNLAIVPYASVALMRRLYGDPDWALIEVDGVSALFARRTPANRAAIAAAEDRWRRLDVPVAADREVLLPSRLPPWPARLLGRHRFPFEAWGRGNAMALLGLMQAARREYGRALREADLEEPALVKNYALTNQYLGRRDEAVAWYRRLLEIDPSSSEARLALTQLNAL